MTRAKPTKRWKPIEAWSANKCETLSLIERSVIDRQANNQRQKGRPKFKTDKKQGKLTNKKKETETITTGKVTIGVFIVVLFGWHWIRLQGGK
jgi:hypothetical protein